MNRTEHDYRKLAAEVTTAEVAIAAAKGVHFSKIYLGDENVDRENAIDGGAADGSPAFWTLMVRNCEMAAGIRAEEYGFDINKLVGRVIY